MAQILAAEKEISDHIRWIKHPDGRQPWSLCDAAVKNPEGWALRLYGRARLAAPYKRSYSLIWTLGDDGHRIFALDVIGDHSNHIINTEQWRLRTHKQIWRDAEPGFAYTPAETIPEEPNAAFLEFCRESNIIFSGQLGVFPPS